MTDTDASPDALLRDVLALAGDFREAALAYAVETVRDPAGLREFRLGMASFAREAAARVREVAGRYELKR